MDSKAIVIFGTGLFAEVAKAYLEEFTPYRVVAFTAHARYVNAPSHLGLPLLAFEHLPASFPPTGAEMFVAVGYAQVNQVRAAVYTEAKRAGYQLATFVHPNVKRWSSNTIGDNCFIFEDNTLQPFATIGNDTILWSGNHIGHHATIGSHCFLASHAVVSGSCVVKDYCFIGVNATLRDGITVETSNVIGAGALVMASTMPNDVFVAPRTELYPKRSTEIRL